MVASKRCGLWLLVDLDTVRLADRSWWPWDENTERSPDEVLVDFCASSTQAMDAPRGLHECIICA